jgi:sigma-B regulation protein RsbU (phosphoserine phosphatase)
VERIFRRSRDVDSNGFCLGWFEIATYSSLEVALAPGDWILLYTDGVSETTENGSEKEFGSEGLRPFLSGERRASADHLADHLLEELGRYSGREEGEDLDDDLTIVAVHVNSPPQ